ncbi:hypothetical protein [uncultured Chryseobacterium sp.]|nr:hypothetical protein [uncultured Chryseobacterium sp.]
MGIDCPFFYLPWYRKKFYRSLPIRNSSGTYGRQPVHAGGD